MNYDTGRAKILLPGTNRGLVFMSGLKMLDSRSMLKVGTPFCRVIYSLGNYLSS